MANLPRQLLALVPGISLGMFLNHKLGVSLQYLLGTRCYFPPAGAPEGAKSRPLRSKRAKKSDELEEMPLIVMRITKQDVAKAELFSQFDTLVFFVLLALCQLAVSELARHLEGRKAVDHMPINLAVLCAAGAVWMLVKVDLLSSYTSLENKVYAGVVGLVAFGLAALALFQAPAWLLGFDPAAAAGAVGALMTAAIQAQAAEGTEVNPVKFPAGALALGLAGAAAAVSMTLFTPTLRFVRCYWLEMNTPEWARDYVGGGPLVKAALQLHLLLPMAATLLWIKPVNDEVLGLSPRDLLLARTAVLLAAGAVQLALVRPLVQRYADTALTGWHQLKHGVLTSKRESKASVAELIRLKCRLVYLLLGKAAVQLLAPGALFLALGLLHLFSALHPALSSAADANGLLESTAGFVAWWAGLTWTLFCLLDLWLFRTGTLQN